MKWIYHECKARDILFLAVNLNIYKADKSDIVYNEKISYFFTCDDHSFTFFGKYQKYFIPCVENVSNFTRAMHS